MADATWTVDGIVGAPDGSDWVRVLGDGDHAGHWRLRDLAVVERFVFGGQVCETGVLGGEPAVRATGDVLGRVVDTFVRMAPEVIDAEVAYADGTSDVVTGTPNDPFWVVGLRPRHYRRRRTESNDSSTPKLQEWKWKRVASCCPSRPPGSQASRRCLSWDP